MEQIVDIVTNFVYKAGYLGVFLLMMLEACCLPIPSEVVLLTAGFLVGKGQFSLPVVLIISLGGALTGSTITYCIGRYGGRPLLNRYGRYIFLTAPRLDATEAWFTRHGSKAVFICRWVSGMRAIVSIPAGLCHMPYPKFLAYTALGSGTWVLVGVLIGRFVGKEWQKLSHVGHYLLVAVILLAGIAFVIHHLHQRKNHNAVTTQPTEICEKVEAGE